MNKVAFLAAALLFTPLPAMSQQAQTSEAHSQNNQSTTPDRNQTMGRENEHGGGQDWLDRLSQTDLKDRLSAGI